MAFNEDVWNKVRNVPKGKVTTYRLIAESMGSKAYRAVGQALKKNPNAPEVPCHRVVCSDGRISGYRGPGTENARKKSVLLAGEGVAVTNGRIDLNRYLFSGLGKPGGLRSSSRSR